MRFATINDTAISDQMFPALHEFFVSHTFNKFMDYGRLGIDEAARDICDNFEIYAHGKVKGAKVIELKQREELVVRLKRDLMNGFIRQGTDGFDVVIRNFYASLVWHMSQK